MSFNLTDDKEDVLCREFIKEYGSGYDPLTLQTLIFDFSDVMEKRKDIAAPVRSFLGLEKDEKDRYKGYFKYLKDNFDITGNVLEIGCGTFPVLAHYVDEHQKLNNSGSIEAFDPLLCVSELGTITLRKQAFNEDVDISNKDFAYAFALKGYYEEFIRIMNHNKLPFCIGLSRYKAEGFKEYEDYYNFLLNYAKETKEDDGIVEMTYLDENYDYEFPIISKKFKTR